MTKRAVKKSGQRSGDQYMLRMPPGLRERVAKRAAENGRSMSSEIIDAIEKHLEEADRFNEVRTFLEKYEEDIGAIARISSELDELKYSISDLYAVLRQRGVLT